MNSLSSQLWFNNDAIIIPFVGYYLKSPQVATGRHRVATGLPQLFKSPHDRHRVATGSPQGRHRVATTLKVATGHYKVATGRHMLLKPPLQTFNTIQIAPNLFRQY